ncbi:hypothetical protein SAMN04488523_11420 [Sulfitobacter brevis]|uniref:Uncharacterized protein n=1 Tax=Sulfitobacter brevis TaxID=74348 RepID=A0A1I2F0C0_9RHOB|nr:hypothetical protein SAMN04488523_11420 [Sulfitobacter brevis]
MKRLAKNLVHWSWRDARNVDKKRCASRHPWISYSAGRIKISIGECNYNCIAWLLPEAQRNNCTHLAKDRFHFCAAAASSRQRSRFSCYERMQHKNRIHSLGSSDTFAATRSNGCYPTYLGFQTFRQWPPFEQKTRMSWSRVLAAVYPAARPRTSSAHWFRLLPDSSAARAALR